MSAMAPNPIIKPVKNILLLRMRSSFINYLQGLRLAPRFSTRPYTTYIARQKSKINLFIKKTEKVF